MSASKKSFQPAKVVWFNDDKGFGFVEDKVGNLIFVHYTAITSKSNARRSLEKDQEIEVQYTEELGELRATRIRDVSGNA